MSISSLGQNELVIAGDPQVIEVAFVHDADCLPALEQ
jgi:hypothetical protein